MCLFRLGSLICRLPVPLRISVEGKPNRHDVTSIRLDRSIDVIANPHPDWYHYVSLNADIGYQGSPLNVAVNYSLRRDRLEATIIQIELYLWPAIN